MNLLRNALVIAALCASCANAATLAEADLRKPTNQFYSGGAEGWYWYQDPADEEALPPEPPPSEEEVKAPPASPTETLPAGPKPFSFQWVKEMLPKYMEAAWDNPTPENVEAYFLVQRFAMDKSNRFSDVSQQVVVGNTRLDETARRPLSSFAVQQVDREARKRADRILAGIANKAGLFFFFKSNCQYCELQAPVLAYLEEVGFKIIAISVDGGSLRNHSFKDTRRDSGHAQLLGVEATPAMFLIDETGKFTALGQSVLSFSELRNRILLVAAREGWISQEEFKLTQPLINQEAQHNLADELPKILHTGAQQVQPAESPIPIEKLQTEFSGFIEPAALLAALKQPQKQPIPKTDEE